jgi:hypothetical protein
VCDLQTSKKEAKSPLKGCEYKPTMGCDAEKEREREGGREGERERENVFNDYLTESVYGCALTPMVGLAVLQATFLFNN